MLIVMSTNLENRGRERRRKRKVSDGLAKLNEKKSNRELQRKIKNKGEIFCWKKNMKIL